MVGDDRGLLGQQASTFMVSFGLRQYRKEDLVEVVSAARSLKSHKADGVSSYDSAKMKDTQKRCVAIFVVWFVLCGFGFGGFVFWFFFVWLVGFFFFSFLS